MFAFYRVLLFLGHMFKKVKVLGLLQGSIFLYFITLASFVPCGGFKCLLVHSISCVIFLIHKDRSTQQNSSVRFFFHLLNFRSFSCWVIPVFLLEYCIITFRKRCLITTTVHGKAQTVPSLFSFFFRFGHLFSVVYKYPWIYTFVSKESVEKNYKILPV